MNRFEPPAAKLLASHHAACVGSEFGKVFSAFVSSLQGCQDDVCVMGVCIKVTAMLSASFGLAVKPRCDVYCQYDTGKKQISAASVSNLE